MFSQHSRHNGCGRPCRPCSCSHTKYAPPATSSKLRPPPKGSPGALGMRGGIAVHLSIDKGRDRGDRGEPGPSSVTPSSRIDCKARRRRPRPPTRSASLTAPESAISHHRAGRRYHAMPSVLVTNRVRDPPFGAPVSACRGDIGAATDRLFCRAEDAPAGHRCRHCGGLGARHEPRPAGRFGPLWWCASP